MKLETQLQTRLLLVAPERLPAVRLFRRNVGTATLRGFKVKFAIAGQCDLYGITRYDSRHLEIELKGPRTPMSTEQKEWETWCKEWSVLHVVLRGDKEETVEKTVERWCGELHRMLHPVTCEECANGDPGLSP